MDVIGVLGGDYCGSTVLARMLCLLPHVAPIGEVHWLVDVRFLDGYETTKAGWKVKPQCVLCGPGCKILTDGIVRKCRSNGRPYDIVGAALQCDHLVVTDKRIDIFQRFIGWNKMLGIVLFKDPKRAVASLIKNEDRRLDEAIGVYKKTHEDIIHRGHTFCKDIIYVSYETLASNPTKTLARIAMKLSLPPLRGKAVLPSGGYHFVGGNPSAHKTSEIALDNSWESRLTPDEKFYIDSKKDVSALHASMLALSLL